MSGAAEAATDTHAPTKRAAMTSTKRVQISFLACAITAVAPFTGRAAQPSVPATGKIVYESCYADLVSWQVLCDIRIWMEGADTLFASLGQLPKWSPDGKKISYIAYGYDYYGDYWSGQVLVADAEPPGDYRIVMPDYSSVYGVEWVSNTRLVFGSDRTGYPEL